MVGYHLVPCSRERRRMMCLEPLEVTGTFLTSSCISLCSSGYRSTHGFYEVLLIKNRWRSTIAPWMTSTPPSSTCHLHMSNSKFRIIFVSYYLHTCQPIIDIISRTIHSFPELLRLHFSTLVVSFPIYILPRI